MLEFIAMVTMLVDHVGAVFYPHVEVLRLIGRVAMPIYAWSLARGVERTHNLRRYVMRVGLVAIAAQPAFSAFWGLEFNFAVSLSFSLVVMVCLDASPVWAGQIAGHSRVLGRLVQVVLRCSVLTAGLMIALFVPMDYGWYGLALVLLYRYVRSRAGLLAGHAALTFIFSGWPGQLVSLGGLGLCLLPVRYPPLLRHRWVYRWFYPVHLTVLALLWNLLA